MQNFTTIDPILTDDGELITPAHLQMIPRLGLFVINPLDDSVGGAAVDDEHWEQGASDGEFQQRAPSI